MFLQDKSKNVPIDSVFTGISSHLFSAPRARDSSGRENLTIKSFGASVDSGNLLYKEIRPDHIEEDLDDLHHHLESLRTTLVPDPPNGLTSISQVLGDIIDSQRRNAGSRNVYMIFSDFIDDKVSRVYGSDFVLQQWETHWQKQFSDLNIRKAFMASHDRSGLILLFKTSPLNKWGHEERVQRAVIQSIRNELSSDAEEFDLQEANLNQEFAYRLHEAIEPVTLDIHWLGVRGGFQVTPRNRACEQIYLQDLQFSYGWGGSKDQKFVGALLPPFSTSSYVTIDLKSDLPTREKSQHDNGFLVARGWFGTKPKAGRLESLSPSYPLQFDNNVRIRSARAVLDRSD
jgi:hypothetical protein